MPKLLSLNVGLPRDVTWNGKTVRTAVWKSPADGRRMVRKLDIEAKESEKEVALRQPKNARRFSSELRVVHTQFVGFWIRA